MPVVLDGDSLTLEALVAVAQDGAVVALADDARGRVAASRALVDHHANGDAAVYGVNTGFGSLSDVRIARDQLGALQLNLIRSHAAGVGEPLDVPAVRATALLRAKEHLTRHAALHTLALSAGAEHAFVTNRAGWITADWDYKGMSPIGQDVSFRSYFKAGMRGTESIYGALSLSTGRRSQVTAAVGTSRLSSTRRRPRSAVIS